MTEKSGKSMENSFKKESARMGESLGMRNATPEMEILGKPNRNLGSSRPLGNGSPDPENFSAKEKVDVFVGYCIQCPNCKQFLTFRCYKNGKFHGVRRK